MAFRFWRWTFSIKAISNFVALSGFLLLPELGEAPQYPRLLNGVHQLLTGIQLWFHWKQQTQS